MNDVTMDDIVQLAMGSFGFLIPPGEQKTAGEFAELIKKYSTDVRVQITAERIAQSGRDFSRAQDGGKVTATPVSAGQQHETNSAKGWSR